MDAVLDIVARLKASLRWFAAAPELRLLHVVAEEDLRIALLQNVAAAELTARPRRPFLFVEAPVEAGQGGGQDAGNDGWSLRAEELIEELGVAQDRMRAHQPGLRFGAVEAPVEVAGESAADQLARFAVILRRVLDALPAELDGLMVVLAPLMVARPTVLRDGLALLIARPELAAVKWIVFETGAGPTSALADRLGARAERLDARVDPAATRAALAAMLGAMRSAPAGAEGYRLAGMAGPRELPPPRRGRAPTTDPVAARQAVAAALSSAGMAPALADGELMQRLRIQVLAASEAAEEARYPDAVRLQAEARDICADAGLLRESVVLELVLGSYALHGGATDLALRVFDQAHARAAGGGLIDLAAQAQIAKGGTLLLQRQRADAALAYLAAGNTAATLPSPILAIEAFRLAGTVLLGLRNEEQAIAAWRRAMAIAEAAPEEQLAGSSAPAAARALAAVCRRHNLVAQADSLIAQAAAWEVAPAVAPMEQPLNSPASAQDSRAEEDG